MFSSFEVIVVTDKQTNIHQQKTFLWVIIKFAFKCNFIDPELLTRIRDSCVVINETFLCRLYPPRCIVAPYIKFNSLSSNKVTCSQNDHLALMASIATTHKVKVIPKTCFVLNGTLFKSMSLNHSLFLWQPESSCVMTLHINTEPMWCKQCKARHFMSGKKARSNLCIWFV